MIEPQHPLLTAVSQLDVGAVRTVLASQPDSIHARNKKRQGVLQVLSTINADDLDMSESVALDCGWEIEHALRQAGVVVKDEAFFDGLLTREVEAVADGHQEVAAALAHLAAWWDHAQNQGWPVDAWADEVLDQVEAEVTTFADDPAPTELLALTAEALVDRGATAVAFQDILDLAQDGDADFEPLARRIQARLRNRDARQAEPDAVRSRARPRA